MWQDCTLRSWLNGIFLEESFNSREQEQIIISNLPSSGHAQNSKKRGQETQDKIFLLTVSDAERYFSTQSDRKCGTTEYARSVGKEIDKDGNCYWWLRTTGKYKNKASIVSYDGYVYSDGWSVNDDRLAVRPALWINLDP